MTSRLRLDYERACAYLGSLQACMSSLERLGVSEPWASGMRADVARLTRSLQAAVEDVERRTHACPDGWTARERQVPSAPEVWAASRAGRLP